jgi:hypothetical protein
VFAQPLVSTSAAVARILNTLLTIGGHHVQESDEQVNRMNDIVIDFRPSPD